MTDNFPIRDNLEETPSYVLWSPGKGYHNLDGSEPTLEQWKALALTRDKVAEGAYRRGVHQAFAHLSYFLEEMEPGHHFEKARAIISAFEEMAGKARFDKAPHPILLHEISNKLQKFHGTTHGWMKRRITFYSWLRGQVKREDPVGDLAREAVLDDGAPRGRKGYTEWYEYLQDRTSWVAVFEALMDAWEEYDPTEAIYLDDPDEEEEEEDA